MLLFKDNHSSSSASNKLKQVSVKDQMMILPCLTTSDLNLSEKILFTAIFDHSTLIMRCANNKVADQLAHLHSLIIILLFAACFAYTIYTSSFMLYVLPGGKP